MGVVHAFCARRERENAEPMDSGLHISPAPNDKLGLQPRLFTARHIATYNEDSFTAMSNRIGLW